MMHPMEPRRLKRVLLLVLSSFIFLTGKRAFAQSEILRATWGDKDDPSTVIVRAVFMLAAPAGFTPLEVTVTNKGKAPVELVLNGQSIVPAKEAGYYGVGTSHKLDSKFRVTAPAEKTTVFSVLVPVLSDHAARNASAAGGSSSYRTGRVERGSLEIALEGPARIRANLLTMGLKDRSTISFSSKLIPPGVDIRLLAKPEGQFASTFEAGSLPQDWRGFSGLQVLAIGGEEWANLQPGQRTAILQWVRFGGKLVHFSSKDQLAAASLTAGSMGAGDIYWRNWNGDPLKGGELEVESNRYFVTGEGCEHAERNLLSKGGARMMSRLPQKSAATWQVGVILLIFGVLVGPVNLFHFARAGRRHKLFLTTPLISLAASAVLLMVIFFQDGAGGRGARFASVYVDPAESSSYVIQQQVSRSGVLFGSAFTVEDALVQPAILPESDQTRIKPYDTLSTVTGQSYRISEEQNCTGDWWQSRSEQAQILQFVAPMRGRIEFTSGAGSGAPHITSTFLGSLEWLFYLDESGQWWKSPGPVGTGQRQTLTKSDEAAFNLARLQLVGQASEPLHRQLTAPALKGHFYAMSKDGSAMNLKKTLNSIAWSSDEIYLFGPVAKSP